MSGKPSKKIRTVSISLGDLPASVKPSKKIRTVSISLGDLPASVIAHLLSYITEEPTVDQINALRAVSKELSEISYYDYLAHQKMSISVSQLLASYSNDEHKGRESAIRSCYGRIAVLEITNKMGLPITYLEAMQATKLLEKGGSLVLDKTVFGDFSKTRVDVVQHLSQSAKVGKLSMCGSLVSCDGSDPIISILSNLSGFQLDGGFYMSSPIGLSPRTKRGIHQVSFPKLKELSLCNQQLPNWVLQPNYPRLKSFHATGGNPLFFGDQNLRDFARKAPFLQKLHIGGPGLHHAVDLGKFDYVTDLILEGYSPNPSRDLKYPPKLERFEIRAASKQFTWSFATRHFNNGFMLPHLLRRLPPTIQEVDVRVEGITTEGCQTLLEAVKEGKMPQLQKFRLIVRDEFIHDSMIQALRKLGVNIVTVKKSNRNFPVVAYGVENSGYEDMVVTSKYDRTRVLRCDSGFSYLAEDILNLPEFLLGLNNRCRWVARDLAALSL